MPGRLICSFLFTVIISSCGADNTAHEVNNTSEASDSISLLSGSMEDEKSYLDSIRSINVLQIGEGEYNEAVRRERFHIKRIDRELVMVNTETSEEVRSIRFENGKVNSFFLSPKNNHCVVYEETEETARNIFFVNFESGEIKEFKVNIYPQINWSISGEYVSIFNRFGNTFYLFNKNGALLFKADYTDLIKDVNPILYLVEVSDDGKCLMLHTSNEILLFKLDLTMIWKIQNFNRPILDVLFKNSLSEIILICPYEQEVNLQDVVFIDKKSGEIVKELGRVSDIRLNNNRLYLKRNNKYYAVLLN